MAASESPSLPLSAVLALYSDTLRYVNQTVADLPEERMAEQPHGLVNHPAWTLAHLDFSAVFLLTLLGDTSVSIDQRDMAHIGPGSKPLPDRDLYPAKSVLLAQLADHHAQAAAAVERDFLASFHQESPEFLRGFSPTVGPIILYLLTAHEPYHLAQISDWRKAAGL
jgi:hypothetical protein